MLNIPWDRGEAAVKSFLQAMLDQHHTDIERLKKRDGGGGGRQSFGAGDSDAYNISQQCKRFVRIVTFCHAGTASAAAVIQQVTAGVYSDTTEDAADARFNIGASGAIVVDGELMSGYAFADEIVRVEFDIPTGIWVVQDTGNLIEQGTLVTPATLASGGTATLTLDRGGTVTVYETLGLSSTISSGAKLKANWSRRTLHWEAFARGCS